MSAATPSVSVVVTNYNYARHVGTAVDSALAQDETKGVEVIVVDDGSTDGSLDVLRRYGDDIRLIAQANGGQGSAFNSGFAASQADIVVFLDADDVLAPDLVRRLESAFADEAVGRVQYPLVTIDGDGRPLGGTVPPAGTELASGDVRRRLAAFPDDITWQPTSGNAFRRRVLEAILPMPTAEYRICADYYLSNLSGLHGDVVVLDRPGGSYRIHDANGHYTDVWTLDAIRSNIVRTSVTHRHLIDAGTAAGLDGLPHDPDAMGSVTALAHRMVSLRLEPNAHPIDSDTRWHLTTSGVSAAWGRFDVGRWRRAMMAAWFVAAAIAPRRLTRRLASPFIEVADVGTR